VKINDGGPPSVELLTIMKSQMIKKSESRYTNSTSGLNLYDV